MAYNVELENRIDKYAVQFHNIKKKKMFGGVGYLLNGNMCFGIHKDSLVIRTTETKANRLIDNKNITSFDITGRPMKGWLLINSEYLLTEKSLINLLDIGNEFAAKLPPK